MQEKVSTPPFLTIKLQNISTNGEWGFWGGGVLFVFIF